MVVKEKPMVRGIKDCLLGIVEMVELIGSLTKDNEGFIELENGKGIRISHYDDGGLNGFISYPAGHDGKQYRITVEHERK